MKSSIRLLLLACVVAILPSSMRASVNVTNNTPGYVMYVLVGHNITCGSYYETNFTCDHYLNYAVPYGDSVVFNDHSEGGDCYHTYWVANITWIPVSGATLTKASSQSYSGTDIFPNICNNAQNEYKEARWKVTLPSGTATLSATGGVSLSKTSNIVNDDVITVTAGSSTGTYQLTLTPSSGSAITASGTVFKFVFQKAVSANDYSPGSATNGAEISGPDFTVEIANDQGTPGVLAQNYSVQGRAGYISRHTKVKVGTEPGAAFGGSVKGAMKVNTWYNPYAVLMKDSADDAPTSSVSATIGPFSLTINGTGTNRKAGVKHLGQIAINSEDANTYNEVQHSTDDFTVPWPYSVWVNAYGQQNQTVQIIDSLRTYSTGSTEVDVRTTIAMLANVTSGSSSTQVPIANSAGQHDIGVTANASYEIQ